MKIKTGTMKEPIDIEKTSEPVPASKGTFYLATALFIILAVADMIGFLQISPSAMAAIGTAAVLIAISKK